MANGDIIVLEIDGLIATLGRRYARETYWRYTRRHAEAGMCVRDVSIYRERRLMVMNSMLLWLSWLR